MQEFKFKVANKIHKVKAESVGSAMQWMNRNVMDQLNQGPWAWMDSASKEYDFYAAAGDFFN